MVQEDVLSIFFDEKVEKKNICLYCEKELETKRKFCDDTCKNRYVSKQRSLENKKKPKKERYCKNCNVNISNLHPNIKFCNKECRSKFYHSESIKKKNEENKDKNYPECKICGAKLSSLVTHLNLIHKISVEEYKEKYGHDSQIVSDDLSKKLSDSISGENNPWFNHGGKLSPFSKNFVLYKDLTEEEKEEKTKEIAKKAKNTTKENGNISTTLEYFLKQTNGDEEEAKKLLSERQSTFSLEKCIEKYGEEKGREVWQERQDKWQNTLNSKDPKEIERINKSKFSKNKVVSNYSQISQELFWIIYNKIKNDFSKIYFATLHEGQYKDDPNNNKEFIIERKDGRHALLDFYIQDINVCLEFNGDYWHGEKRGNQQRDKKREEQILLNNPNMRILYIKEKDYNKDKQKIIQECLNFIYGNVA